MDADVTRMERLKRVTSIISIITQSNRAFTACSMNGEVKRCVIPGHSRFDMAERLFPNELTGWN